MGCGTHVGGLWRPCLVDLEPVIAPAHPNVTGALPVQLVEPV